MITQKTSNCTITNRKLKKYLVSFLKYYGLFDFVTLFQKMKLDVTFPIKLIGTRNKVRVIDAKNEYFTLSFLKKSILLKQFDNHQETCYLFNICNFSIEQFEIIADDEVTKITIDVGESSITLDGDFGILYIYSDNPIPRDKIISKQVIELCNKIVEDYSFLSRLDVQKVKEQVFDIFSDINICVFESVISEEAVVTA